MKRCLPLPLLLFYLLCLPALPIAAAQEPATIPAGNATAAAAGVTGRMDAVLAAPAFRHASVGVLVRSLADGRVLYERNADLALMPASNQKILTAATALMRLGPEHRFTTSLLRTGTVDRDGTLRGDLILRGTGDPSLMSERLAQMARAVHAAGIRRIEGRLLADDSFFDARYLGAGWQWDNEPYAYQPQVSALNCDENVLIATAEARSRRVGETPIVMLRPQTGYVSVRNDAEIVAALPPGSGGIDFSRTRGRNEFVISGTIAAGGKAEAGALTVEDPAIYAVTRLRELLSAAGVGLAPSLFIARGRTPTTGATVVTETVSEPLRVLCANFLKNSNNLYGETFLKAAGARAVSGPGSSRAGGRAVAETLQAAKVEASGLSVADGSGLSRMNTVTPRILVGLLTFMDRDAPASVREAFTAALPIAGVDGTLRNRLKKTVAEGKVRAKTGTLSGVSALSGYLTTAAGEPVVFSILMNNYARAGGASAARAAQDALVLAIAETAVAPSTLSPPPTP